MVWLLDGEKFLKISLFVWTYTLHTDRQTDTQTLHDDIGRAYASHRAAKILTLNCRLMHAQAKMFHSSPTVSEQFLNGTSAHERILISVTNCNKRTISLSKHCCWHRQSKQWCMLMAGKDGKMFMTRSFNITTKTTEQHLIACSDKSVAYVTNNKRLCSTFCTIEDNYWQTRSIVWPLCDSRATCFLVEFINIIH